MFTIGELCSSTGSSDSLYLPLFTHYDTKPLITMVTTSHYFGLPNSIVTASPSKSTISSALFTFQITFTRGYSESYNTTVSSKLIWLFFINILVFPSLIVLLLEAVTAIDLKTQFYSSSLIISCAFEKTLSSIIKGPSSENKGIPIYSPISLVGTA
jgi:hypothetical protein